VKSLAQALAVPQDFAGRETLAPDALVGNGVAAGVETR